MHSAITPVGMALGSIPVPSCDSCTWLEDAGPHMYTLALQQKKEITNTWHNVWPVQPLLTFSNDLVNSDLVPPDSEGSANEISACMTGPRAATSSSRTRPGAHQLPTRIKELPHVVATTGVSASITDTRDRLLVSCAVNYCTDR